MRFKFIKQAETQNETEEILRDIESEMRFFNRSIEEPFALASLSYADTNEVLKDLLAKLKQTNDFLFEKLNQAGTKRYAKVVQVGDKWQAQSEKGRSFGTYDTKAEAEKRVQQMEMFKHLKKKGEEIENTRLTDMQEPNEIDANIEKNSRRYNVKRRKKHRYWSF